MMETIGVSLVKWSMGTFTTMCNILAVMNIKRYMKHLFSIWGADVLLHTGTCVIFSKTFNFFSVRHLSVLHGHSVFSLEASTIPLGYRGGGTCVSQDDSISEQLFWRNSHDNCVDVYFICNKSNPLISKFFFMQFGNTFKVIVIPFVVLSSCP